MTGPLPDPTEGAHRIDTNGGGASEPVLLSHAVSSVLYLLAATGWIALPDQRLIDSMATALALVVSVSAAILARSRVTPSGRITWDGVRGTIRAMVWDEIDRLAAAAPAVVQIPSAPKEDPGA